MNPDLFDGSLLRKEDARKSEPKPKAAAKRKPLARGKRPRQVSDKQSILNAKWAGVKDGIIEMMTRYDPDGPHCERCGKRGNRGTLEAHHLRSRAQGGSYDARNCMILCSSCHREETGDVRWSRRAS